ncbi:IS110 family transposase [Thiomicrorhabdus hydrogeniphila]
MTKDITTIGVDIAKHTFHLVFANQQGKPIQRKQLNRSKFKELIQTHEITTFVLEACGTSHYWARTIQQAGHEVKLINPAFVKPFVMSNKNDFNDATAIIVAANQPTMRYVSPKSTEQQDVLMLHRVRERMVNQKTALINQIRGLLAEFGIVIKGGAKSLMAELPFTLEDPENGLSPLAREQFYLLYQELKQADQRLSEQSAKIERLAQQDPVASKLQKLPGVGFLTASAIAASVGDPLEFKNGRQFSAWLGLVPKQNSTGGKNVLLSISKRGDGYLRRLLVQGALTAIARSKGNDNQVTWAKKLRQAKCIQVAAVALANKTARIMWSLMAHNKEYQVM